MRRILVPIALLLGSVLILSSIGAGLKALRGGV